MTITLFIHFILLLNSIHNYDNNVIHLVASYITSSLSKLFFKNLIYCYFYFNSIKNKK